MTVCKYCGIIFIPDIRHPKVQRCSSTKCHSAYKLEWAHKNPEKTTEHKKGYISRNPEKRKESSSAYRKRNRTYYTAYASLRTRHMRYAQPKWADTEDLLNVYLEAQYFGYEVDHIIPIKHPLVCGLHVWNNLQLLTRSENAKKSNKFSLDEDIIGVIK